MEPAPAAALARRLLGRVPDEIRPLVGSPERSVYRIDVAGEFFVLKTDVDPARAAREISGHRRAAAAAIPVPEIVAVAAGAFVMRFVPATALGRQSTDAAWRAAGATIRRMHNVTPGGGNELIGAGFGTAAPTGAESAANVLSDALDRCVREMHFNAVAADRIRTAFAAARPRLEAQPTVWSHGDLQPEHVLVAPGTEDIAAVIDWADHGPADPAWDLAVVTLDDRIRLDAVLDGYTDGRRTTNDARDLRGRVDLYQALRLVTEAVWFAERGLPHATAQLERAAAWIPAAID